MFHARISPILALGPAAFALASALGGCGAGGSGGEVDPNTTGSTGGPGGSGQDPTVGFNPDDVTFDEETQTVGCSQFEVSFERQTPTALIVVDRSSSQWDQYPNHTWEPMKAGILDVVQNVQADIRVGMVTYTGQNGGACPDLYPPPAEVTFGLDNYPAVEAAINAVGQPAYKGETPTAVTIQQALPLLMNDPGPGEKVMLLVTDGDPDFCNDPDRVCSMDAVIGAVQAAYAMGVSTTVFGLRRAELSEQHLRDVANAGTGQPVALPPGINTVQDLRNRCVNNPVGSLPGTYSPTSGNAQYFQANGTDQIALGAALDAVIYGIRSCVFDLGGAVEIDPTRVADARITIDGGNPLVYDDPNGWHLLTTTQVELLGSSCQQLKNPATTGIEFDFPCDVLILR
jgi:hypothetical protein